VEQHPPRQAELKLSSGLGEDADDTPSWELGGSESTEAEKKYHLEREQRRDESIMRKFKEQAACIKGRERENKHLG